MEADPKHSLFHQLSPSQQLFLGDYIQWLEEMVKIRLINEETLKSIHESLQGFSLDVLNQDLALGIKNAIENIENAMQLGPHNPHSFSWIQAAAITLREIL